VSLREFTDAEIEELLSVLTRRDQAPLQRRAEQQVDQQKEVGHEASDYSPGRREREALHRHVSWM
jgi:hypothetical protein